MGKGANICVLNTRQEKRITQMYTDNSYMEAVRRISYLMTVVGFYS